MKEVPNPHGQLEETAQSLSRIIDSSVLRLWETIESLEGLHPQNLERFRVSLFGSSRIGRDDPLFKETMELARRLTEAGCDVLNGGGSGLMQAANEGACGRGKSQALRGDLPLRVVEGKGEGGPGDRIYHHRTFFSRLHHFVRLSSAYIVLPGGLGTTLEAMMVWQLLQVNHIPPAPFLLYGSMWKGLLKWAEKEMGPREMVSPEDLELPVLVSSIDEVVEIILRHMEKFGRAQAINVEKKGDRKE